MLTLSPNFVLVALLISSTSESERFVFVEFCLFNFKAEPSLASLPLEDSTSLASPDRWTELGALDVMQVRIDHIHDFTLNSLYSNIDAWSWWSSTI